MLEAYFESQFTLGRLRSCLFGQQLDEFANWLQERGYGSSPGRRLIRGANRFASWAESQNLAIGDLDEAALASFRRHLAARDLLRYPNGSYSNAFRGARHEEATLVVSGKNRREARLPLPKDVGDASRFYLENYRPRVESKEVFISRKAPLGPITYSTISRTARRTLERAGIDAPSYGAHVFRHSAATGLLRQGASLQTIGTLLRHDPQ